MNNKDVIFLLNEKEEIVLELSNLPSNDIPCCYEAPILLLQDGKKVVLSTDDVLGNMLALRHLLTKTLSNELQLDQSIVFDIGYVYNEYCNVLYKRNASTNCKFVYKISGNSRLWIGSQYSLWAHDYMSWIYNSADGSIVLELTPLYANGFPYKGKEATYKKWLQAYKPYLIRIIPHKIAERWLVQANDVIKRTPYESNIK
jgi:hypothetical protein